MDEGIPPAYLLYVVASSPEAQKLGARLPASWLPKSLEELLLLPEGDFLTCAFRAYLWRDPNPNELPALSGRPRMWVLFNLFTAARAVGIDCQFPAEWLPKTGEGLRSLALAGEDFLTAIFRNYLWRDPAPNEFAPFADRLTAGTPPGVIFNELALSEEAKRLRLKQTWLPKTFDELISLADEEFLEAAYRNLLWRPPDAAGIENWEGLLKNGVPRAFVLHEIAFSPEGRQFCASFPDYWTPKSADFLLTVPAADFLADTYRSILWREPDRQSRQYADEFRWGRSRISILREIANSDEASRIPYRIAGLDHVPDSRYQIPFRVRKKIYTLLRQAADNILGLDRNFDILHAASEHTLRQLQQDIARTEREVRSHKISDDFLRREFERLRESSAGLQDGVSQQLHEQWRSIRCLAETLSKLQENLDDFSRQHIRFESHWREIAATGGSMLSKLDQGTLFISSKLDEAANRLATRDSATISKLDHSTSIISSKLNESTSILSAKLDASISVVASKLNDDTVRSALSESVLSKLDETTALIASKLDANTTSVTSQNSQINVGLSRKLDDSTALLAGSLASLKTNLAIPLPDNLLLTKVRNLYYFIPAEDAQLVACLVIGGHIEPGMADFMEKWVQPGMTVVDVGANIGLHSLACARLVGVNGRVYCFEPSPRMVKILEMNLVMNQLKVQSRIEQVAVTDTPGTAQFYLTEICGHSSLYESNTAARAIDVCTGSLDSLLPQDARIDFVKIDAEGAEPVIIRGMKQTIERNPAISIAVEFAPSLLERANHSPASFIEELVQMGFSMLRIDDMTGEVAEVEYNTLLATPSTNLLLRKVAKG